MIIDADSGKVLGDIPGQTIAHGVAVVPGAGRGSGLVVHRTTNPLLRCL